MHKRVVDKTLASGNTGPENLAPCGSQNLWQAGLMVLQVLPMESAQTQGA